MAKLYDIRIIMDNDLGNINITLDEEYAPITVNHFVKLIKDKIFDGTIFHRVIDNFMIQTGGYKVLDQALEEIDEVESIKGEFKSNGVNNELKHELGVISMARTSIKDSATSQFFICVANCPWLDGEYAAFGYTNDEESKELIKKIAGVKTYAPHPNFQDFPVELISIKTIEIISERDK